MSIILIDALKIICLLQLFRKRGKPFEGKLEKELSVQSNDQDVLIIPFQLIHLLIRNTQ